LDAPSSLPRALVDHLRAGKTMQIASSSSAGPRVFSVWYAVSDDFSRLVFISNRNRHHSREFALNPQAGGTIVAIELEGLGQKVEGVSFFGEVSEPGGDDLVVAYRIYADKWPQVRGMFSVADIAAGSTDMRVYDVAIKQWVFFSEREYPESPRQEFQGVNQNMDSV
jgi:uncharacterized protein YhbP (UPF0306 family)